MGKYNFYSRSVMEFQLRNLIKAANHSYSDFDIPKMSNRVLMTEINSYLRHLDCVPFTPSEMRNIEANMNG